MKELISEAFRVSKTRDLRKNPIAFIDPSAPENKDTFQHKDIFKKHGAQWSKSPNFKNIFPAHGTGFWFWFLGPTEDKWRDKYKRFIEPALIEAHRASAASDEDSAKSLAISIDTVVDKIQSTPPSFDEENGLTKEDKDKIVKKLDEFKSMIVGLKDEEEFKEVMKKIIAFKNAQGHQFSLINSILVAIQRPDAKIVKSKSNWMNLYNRTINERAKAILIWKPGEKFKQQYSRQEKETITDRFLKSVGKQRVEDLGVGEKERLNVKLSGKFGGGRFDLYGAYDVSDTTLIQGKEDTIQPALKGMDDIKWFDDEQKDDRIKPIYNALLNYSEGIGINVELVGSDVLGDARGRSVGGKVQLLHNDGNSVGTTKTFVHEIGHELLHQRYLKDKDPELKKFFVGQAEGRAAVEQQAELTAWMVMHAFGFDVKTTSMNYVLLWGADDKKMIDVFNNVSNVANHLISEIVKRRGGLDESDVDLPGGGRFSPMDVARFIGHEKEFQDVVKAEKEKEKFMEHFFRLSKGKKNIKG
jgi:hypothetical protein